MPNPDLTIAQDRTTFLFAAEPALNNFNSLFTLQMADHKPAMPDWVLRTAASLSPEGRHQHQIVMYGLYYAIVPDRSFPDFPAYIKWLAKADPYDLRDRMLDAYTSTRLPLKPSHIDISSPQDLLQDLDFYLEYLRSRFGDFDEDIEAEAFELLLDPPVMQNNIVSHIGMLWEDYLEDEWARVKPFVDTSVEAFRRMQTDNMSSHEIFQAITGEMPDKKWQDVLESTQNIVFVPSAHMGPYKHKLCNYVDITWIFIGLRDPQREQAFSTELNKSDVLVRLNALADEARLSILTLVAERGEICTSDIMDALEMSQSTAQRHLKQLTATGYLLSRRIDGAKCFSLNPDRIKDTFRAIEQIVGI